MSKPLPDSTRLAWNGIELRLPAGWEPTGVGRRLLQISADDGPAMDVKWSIVSGRFSFDKHLKRLRKGLAKGEAGRLRELSEDDPLRIGAREAFPDAEVRSWALAGVDGDDALALLHRPSTGLTLLALFHRRGRDIPRTSARRVLGSLRDHHGEEALPFQIYDVQARIPSSHSLTGHILRPGLYRLDFAAKGSALTLHRFAPADVILGDTSLEAWSGGQSKKFIRRHALSPLESSSRVDWRMSKSPGPLSRFLTRISGRLPGGRLLLWRPEGRNVLMGIEAEGRAALDETLFDAVRRDYVPLP